MSSSRSSSVSGDDGSPESGDEIPVGSSDSVSNGVGAEREIMSDGSDSAASGVELEDPSSPSSSGYAGGRGSSGGGSGIEEIDEIQAVGIGGVDDVSDSGTSSWAPGKRHGDEVILFQILGFFFSFARIG